MALDGVNSTCWKVPDNDAIQHVDVSLMLGAALSVVCCLIIFVSYFRAPELRRHPNNLVFYRTVADFVFAVLVFVQYIAFESAGHKWRTFATSGTCQALSFLNQFTILGAELWFFTVSVDLYLALQDPFTNYKRNRNWYLVVFLVGGLATACIVAFSHGSSDCPMITSAYGLNPFHLCWVQQQGSGVNVFMWGMFYMPVLLMYMLGLGVLIYASRRLNKGLRQTYETRRQAFAQGRSYLFAYIIYWAMETVFWGVFFLEDTLNMEDNEVVTDPAVTVFVFTFTGKSLVSLIIWARAHDLPHALCGPREKNGERAAGSTHLAPHLNVALRQELLHYTRVVIRLSVLQADMAGSSLAAPRQGDRGGGTLSGLLRGKSQTRVLTDWRDLETEGYDTLIDGLDEEEAERATLVDKVDVRAPSVDAGGKRNGKAKGAGAATSSGDATTTGSERAPPKTMSRIGTVQALKQQAEAIGVNIGIHMGPPLVKRMMRPPMAMQDLAPSLFSTIRGQFGITSEEYVNALRKTVNERFSEGASGAFMCFSHDMRFVVKTMERAEAEVLRTILRPYVKYLKANPDTLLSKFYGCCALRLYKKQLYFVVMDNIFETTNTIHERYDLKGSWVNRNAGKVQRGTKAYCRYCNEAFRVEVDSSRCPARPNRSHVPSTVLKDNDLNFKIRLTEERALKLGAQLRSDAKFLRSQGIMDYSLLMGVHRRKFRLDSGRRGGGLARVDTVPSHEMKSSGARHAGGRVPAFRNEEGGIMPRVIEGPGVVYLGIIDILQTWTFGKKMERMAKIARYGREATEGISAREPAAYYRRFEQRVIKEVIEHGDKMVEPEHEVFSPGDGLLGLTGTGGGVDGSRSFEPMEIGSAASEARSRSTDTHTFAVGGGASAGPAGRVAPGPLPRQHSAGPATRRHDVRNPLDVAASAIRAAEAKGRDTS